MSNKNLNINIKSVENGFVLSLTIDTEEQYDEKQLVYAKSGPMLADVKKLLNGTKEI